VEPKLFGKWMKNKYGFSINPKKMEWVIRTHVEDFDWMLGLDTPSIIHLLDLRLTIPPSFSLLRNPENLLILNLHGNNYTHLNIFDCPLPSLKDLSFSSNNIRNLEGPLDFPNLIVLRINDNNIDLSSISNLRLPNLDTLQLSSNKLSSFKGLEKLEAPKLRKIELDFNRFDTLEGIERLNKFTNLSYIYFIGNASLGSLRGLEKLDIPKKCIIDIEGCQIRKSEIDRFFSSNPKSFLTFIY
jgi:Leucine-rich repeat (LRR) protein